MTKQLAVLAAAFLMTTPTIAAPVTYVLDPMHTYPSFEADHFGGLSVWRGKFRKSTGKVVYDKEAQAGTVSVTVEVGSIDYGLDKMDEHARSPDIFDAAKYPTATFEGKLAKFDKSGAPTEVEGTLTLHGVTKPVTLKVNSFLCKVNPMSKKEVCGADASAEINRADFGVNYGEAYGFKQAVKLLIQVEGVRAD